MRISFLLIALVPVLLIVGAIAGRSASDRAANAQTNSAPPLLFNEISQWCPNTCEGSFSAEDGGYVRLVINSAGGGVISGYCEPMTVPDGVEGWAFVQTVNNSLPERPTYPVGATDAERASIDATWISEVPVLKDFEKVSIDDVRSNPELPVCELLVRAQYGN